MMIAKNANDAINYMAAADCNDFAFVSAGRFTPDHEWDFGEVHSVFAPLIRQYSNEFVGKYLGKQDDGYVVAILNPNDSLDLIGCEVYDNLDELHGEWQLDMNHELVN